MNRRHRRILLNSVLTGLVGLSALAASAGDRPRLVVGIMVDQLRTDYVEYLRGLFGTDGFRLLADSGVYFRDIRYASTPSDALEATVAAATGSAPYRNGVTGAERFDPVRLKAVKTLADPKGGDETYTPEPIRVSTLSDEIMIDGAGLGLVYSLATDAQTAVALAGHSGTGAFWVSPATGRWTATTYYGAPPQPVSLRNMQAPLSARIDTMQWKPLLELDRYPGLPEQKRYYPFRHTFPRRDRDVYARWNSTPLANAEVTTLAIDFLRSLKVGSRGKTIDVLNLGYTLAPYKHVSDGDYRLELQDAYLRLDRQLARLFAAIRQYVGMDNTLVYLISSGRYDDATADDAKYRLPGGTFSAKRAVSLLNSYLTALHGQADYVKGYHGGHIYLNSKAIESRGVKLSDAAREARDFLRKMSGVSNAYTLADIQDGNDAETAALRAGIDPKTGGDVVILFAPGWSVADDTVFPVQTKQIRTGTPLAPAFILAPGTQARTISTPVAAEAVAPTVSQILRIRSPNGSTERPVAL